MNPEPLPTNQVELLSRIDRDWATLQGLVSRLSETEMAQPDDDGWSPKDNLAHLAAWLEVLLRFHLDHQPVRPIVHVDETMLASMDETAVNDAFVAQTRHRSLSDVLAGLSTSHAQVKAILAALSFDTLLRPRLADDPEQTPRLAWVVGNTYDHYQEHTATLRRAVARAAGPGRFIWIGDTRLHVVERGEGYPLLVLHGGPGLDHHSFGDYLDPLTDQLRLIYVDQRSQGLSDQAPEETWTLAQMAADVVALADALALESYAVLGHSYGAFVALQNAVDFPGRASHTIISSGLPSARFLEAVDRHLAAFEPVELRAQVASSWEREKSAATQADVAALLQDQWPFHFANPLDPRIQEADRRTAGAVFSPHVLRHFANQEYGAIEVEDRLDQITQPVLVLAGRHDRVCVVEGAEAMAARIPQAELVICEDSAHMTYIEENDRYLAAVRAFLTPP